MAILKDLIVHGSSRFLNKIYASEIQTPLIEAEAGIFKKLKADDATVVSLLDVKGQMHTNSWSNSNIATIDGSFYITPTIGSASGTVTITASSLAFSGTNYAISSLYLGDGSSITWPQYSKVLITGQILSNEQWIPLGTLLGQLSSTATAASISINNIKDNKNQTSNVLATLVNEGTTSSSYRNLKVSLYQRASSSTAFYPLGIYMTATGTNGRTFLDIYGGVEALSNNNNYGGLAEPNVRIGNLQGLPNVGGQTPSGWGIYTDNGYFKGIIAADRGYIGTGSKYWVIANEEDGSNAENSRSYIYNGKISYNDTTNDGVYLGTDGIGLGKGNFYVTKAGSLTAKSGSIGGWQLDANSFHTGTWGKDNSALICTGTGGSKSIGGSESINNWVFTAGANFGVTKSGALYASSANIQGTITATGGTIGGASITNGTLIIGNANINDINASKINAGDIAAARIQTNLISAINAKVNDLSALTATIGGFQIDSSSVHTKNVIITSNADNSIALSSADFTRTINSTSRTGLRFAIGDKFGVTGDGTVYASNVDLTGKIIATSGTIGGIEIENGALKVSSINIGNLGGASNYAKKTDVTQAIDNIEVGGRNLLKKSNNLKSTDTTKGITFTYLEDGWFAVKGTVTGTSAGVLCFYGNTSYTSNITSSGEYTLSIETDGTIFLPSNKTFIQLAYHSDNATNNTLAGDFKILSGSTKVTFTIPENHHISRVCLFIQANATDSVVDGNIRLKLEKGNKATDWTPAPEDVDEAIDNIEIGGRNLIRNSADFDKWVVKNGGANGDIWSRSVSGNTSNVNLRPRTWIGTGNLADYYNKTLVVSFEIMSPDWSAIEEGASNTGLNGLAIQLETVDGTPYSSSIGSTGRYFFKRLGDENYFKTDSDLVDGSWVKITSVPLKIDNALWNNSTTLIDGYDYFTFSFILRRNGTVSFRKPQIEIGTKATDWTLAPEDIIVGKNLIPLSKNLKSFTPENLTRSTVTYTDDSCTITNTYGDVRYGVYYDINVKSGSTYTLSFQASNVSGTNINYGVGNRTPDQTASWNDITGGYKDVVNGSNVCTFTIPDTVTKVRIYFGAGSLNGSMTISNLKLEVGNRATEWTSAPEDIQYAMKVANNYLSMDETGIMIADMNDGEQKPSKATGRNVFIDNDSVDIRNGTTTLASFTGDNTKFYDPIYNKELATFGASGAMIGVEGEQRFVIEKDSVRAINSSGGTLFSIVSTDKTFITEAEAAPSGECDDSPLADYITRTLDAGDSTTDNSFYIDRIYIIVSLTNSSKVLTNVKINSIAVTADRFKYNTNTAYGFPYSSSHSIDVPFSPAFSCNYGTSKSSDYVMTATFINDYGDSYNLTFSFKITYNGARKLTFWTPTEECIRTSGNNEAIAKFDVLNRSKYEFSQVISNTANTRAPAITFGTRTGEDGMLSSAFGQGLYAEKDGEFVIGRYNNQELQTDSKYSFVIGNGLTEEHRSNALTIDWSGNICLGIDVTGSETDADLLIAIQNAGWESSVIE